MIFSYRTRRFLGKFFRFLIIFCIIATIGLLCWLLWLQRFVVYTSEGVKLDFSLGEILQGQVAVPPEPDPDILIQFGPDKEEDKQEPSATQLLKGYYIPEESLYDNIPALLEKLKKLPAGTPVLLDVKSPKGYFYYSSDLEEASDSTLVDVAQMDELFAYLAESKLYTIARLPAFRDWRYGLNNVPSGLPEQNKGGALWMDDTGCYWLDPTDQQALSYLVRITKELQNLGFDEVVFDDFRFPVTNQIVFSGDKTQAIADAAATLATACATEQFCVSFMSSTAFFQLPTGNCRVYLQNVAAEDADTFAQQVNTDDPALHVLFMTTTNDTRFDKYCVLRPLDSAH